MRGAADLERGPERSGVFARFADDGRRSSCSTSRGTWRAPSGRATAPALVVALRPRADELVWLVTGLDEAALEAGARALTERPAARRLRRGGDRRRVEKLPLESP